MSAIVTWILDTTLNRVLGSPAETTTGGGGGGGGSYRPVFMMLSAAVLIATIGYRRK